MSESNSESITRGLRVQVETEYCEMRSRPHHGLWFFLYTVSLLNEGDETLQLMARHWIIQDGDGKVEEVKGPGVVGEHPVLRPGESFQYTSGCPLATPFGSMKGTYQMVTDNGEEFDAEVAAFTLSGPYTVH